MPSAVEGIIEKKSKAGTGICINGKWYNAAYKTEVDFTSVLVGDQVSLELNDRDYVVKLTLVKSSPKTPTGNVYSDSKDLNILKSNVVYGVFRSPTVASLIDGESTEDSVAILCDVAEAIERYLIGPEKKPLAEFLAKVGTALEAVDATK